MEPASYFDPRNDVRAASTVAELLAGANAHQ